MGFALAFLPFPASVFGESAQSAIESGISHYQRQEYEEAAQRFLEARVDLPDHASLAYNLANANYKRGKYAEAIQGYTQAATHGSDSSLRQRAYYNIGNSLYRLGKLEEAASSYKKALELDSTDMDAKFNLEYVREQLKKKNQRQNKKSPRGNSPENKKNQDPGSETQDGDNEASKKDRNQDKTQQNPRQQDSENEAPKPEKPEPRPGQNASQPSALSQTQPQKNSMTKEQAERWLFSLEENQKEIFRRQIMMNAPKSAYKGKDW